MKATPGPAILVIASFNDKKREELRRLLGSLPVEVCSLRDFPGVPEAPEEGETFAENARAKACFYANRIQALCLADDSGLEVDALGGAPGVYSARFAGEGATDSRNRALLLRRLEGVEEAARTARFRCAAALADPAGVRWEGEGTCEGSILRAELGDGGFGYDPLFLSVDLGMTFAEASRNDKDRVSHRGRALRDLRTHLLAHEL